jgi:hypothetical protein
VRIKLAAFIIDTEFKLYEPGAEVVLAEAYLWLKDFEQAEDKAISSYEKAVGMKYRWAEGDAADLLGEIYSVRGDKPLPCSRIINTFSEKLLLKTV